MVTDSLLRGTSDEESAYVELRDIAKRYGTVEAIRGLSLTIRRGEFFCILGPSGSGKTTVLNVIGGLVHADSGAVYLDDRNITDLPMERRDIGIVFQSYALFPHMSVEANIAFGLEVRHVLKADVETRVHELLRLTHLDGKAARRPRELSGGEQQRVALARALAIRPRLLVLDEPLSNLDAALRVELRAELRRIQRQSGITTIMVTHDQEEAFAVADRIALLNRGSLIQIGSPEALYLRPETLFAAKFVGHSTLVGALVRSSDGPGLEIGDAFIPIREPLQGVGRVAVAIRPDRVRVTTGHPGAEVALRGVVNSIAYLGQGWRYEVGVDGVGAVVATEPLSAKRTANVGDKVFVSWMLADGIVLDASEA